MIDNLLDVRDSLLLASNPSPTTEAAALLCNRVAALDDNVAELLRVIARLEVRIQNLERKLAAKQ